MKKTDNSRPKSPIDLNRQKKINMSDDIKTIHVFDY